MAYLTHSEQTDKCFRDQTDHRIGCSINWRDPPEMNWELASSKNQRTASVGKRLNQRLSHGRDELFWGRQKCIEYPARRHRKTNARPNRNATFHTGTPVSLSNYLTNSISPCRSTILTGCTDSSSFPRA